MKKSYVFLLNRKYRRHWAYIHIYMPSNPDFWSEMDQFYIYAQLYICPVIPIFGCDKKSNFPLNNVNQIVFVFLHPMICIWAPQAKFLCFWYSKHHFYNEFSILFMKIFACGAKDPQDLYICPVIYMPSNPDFWSEKAPSIYMPSYIYGQ